jgi:hypothetical protein
MSKTAVFFIPDQKTVDGLAVGDTALDCFGSWAVVDSITYRGTDIKGRAFVGFYTVSTNGLKCSQSYKVGKLVRTVATSAAFQSADLDQIEAETAGRGLFSAGRTDCTLTATAGGGWLLDTDQNRST